jgi:TonB family protein
MATSNPEAHHGPHSGPLALLHPWIDFVPRQQRRLGLFIGVALAIHLAAFFFIRIDATRAELQHQARTHVTVENAHPAIDAEGTDAFWDALTDPRLFLLPVVPLTQLSPNEQLPGLSEINSSLGTQQLPAAAEADIYPIVPAAEPPLQQQVIADLHPARQPFSYDENVPAPDTKTTWQWDPAFAARQATDAPDLPSPVSDTDLSPTELRLAVSADGTVQHVLLEETCQKPELDQLAILAARKLRFHPATQPGLAWGRATVFWHCTPPPREVVVPTPPSF